jgi:hypothetical protein
MPFGEFERRALVGVANCRQSPQLGEVADQVAAPIAAADRRYPYRTAAVPAGRQRLVCQSISPMLPQSG